MGIAKQTSRNKPKEITEALQRLKDDKTLRIFNQLKVSKGQFNFGREKLSLGLNNNNNNNNH